MRHTRCSSSAVSPARARPSRLDNNPTVWMIERDVLIVNARHRKREFPEEAFRKGSFTSISNVRASSLAECPMSHNQSGSGPPRFQPEDKVRVRHGTREPEFPDIPIGGWAGTVKEVEQNEDQTLYLIAWNRATLRGMHSIYKKRCERDGLDLESMWLGDDEIEPDDGAPVSMEQPTSIVTKPLSDQDQDDRVRIVFGLTHDDLLPDVSEKSLLAYHRYLATRLKFPIPITFWEDSGPHVSKKVTTAITRLADPPMDYEIGEGYGLTCWVPNRKGEEVEIPLDEIELGKNDANQRLLEDYSYWFHNWQ